MPRKTKKTSDNNIDDLQASLQTHMADNDCQADIRTNKSNRSKHNKDSDKDDEVEVLEEVRDSSEISDIDENQDIPDAFEEYDEEEKKDAEGAEFTDEYINTVVADRVIKYLKLDDLMKEKQAEHKKEIKTIKDTKEQLEQFLITYLDKVNEEYIQLGGKSTLTKVEKESISPPKMEDVSVCLIEGFRRHEIYDNDDKIKQVVEDFMKQIEIKRERKVRKYLKRSSDEEKKKQNGDTTADAKSSAKGSRKQNKKEQIDNIDQGDMSIEKVAKNVKKVKTLDNGSLKQNTKRMRSQIKKTE